MSRRRFEAYLDKVFGFFALAQAMAEGRHQPRHPWLKVFTALFLGAASQMSSLLEIEAACRRGSLAKRVGPISNNTFGYAMQRQDPEALFALGCMVAKQIKRNSMLLSTWSRGFVVAAVDGIEICSSYARCCPRCLERRVERRIDGHTQECIQYYHRIVAVIVVSGSFPVPLGVRFQQPGEGEVSCALALLQDLTRTLGRRYFDILVADALYLQKPFVEQIEQLGLRWVINLKDNQPDLAAAAERMTLGPPDGSESDARRQLHFWHLPELCWPAADRTVGILKTARRSQRQRTVIADKTVAARQQRQSVEETATNYYASNLDLGSIPPLFLHQLGRSRWKIDAQVFQTITADCHLKKPSAHQSRALVVLTMIRLLAYTLSLLFYHRQVLSHRGSHVPATFREFARSLRVLSYLPDSS
ncbi:MAG: transposase [Bryobacteraceae bacterium]